MTTLLPLKTQQAAPATQKKKTTNTDVWNGSAQEGGRAQNYREQRGAPTSKRRGASWGSGARLESPPGVSMGRVFFKASPVGRRPRRRPGTRWNASVFRWSSPQLPPPAPGGGSWGGGGTLWALTQTWRRGRSTYRVEFIQGWLKQKYLWDVFHYMKHKLHRIYTLNKIIDSAHQWVKKQH